MGPGGADDGKALWAERCVRCQEPEAQGVAVHSLTRSSLGRLHLLQRLGDVRKPKPPFAKRGSLRKASSARLLVNAFVVKGLASLHK